MLITDDALPPSKDNARLKPKTPTEYPTSYRDELFIPKQSITNMDQFTAELWTRQTRKNLFPGNEKGVRELLKTAIRDNILITDNSDNSIIDAYLTRLRTEVEFNRNNRPHDTVNNPTHYQLPGLGIEFLDVRRALCKGIPTGTSYMAVVCWSESITYMARMWKKNGLEDAKKARYYIDRVIEELENEGIDQ